MAADAVGTRGLACERDVVRVAAERGDVALHPAQRGLLVQEPERARPVQPWQAEEAEDPEPVVDGDHDQRPGLGEAARVGVAARARVEPAPVDPHQHRQPGVGRGPGGHGDVEREAVLGGAPGRGVRGAGRGGELGTPGPRLGRRAGAAPGVPAAQEAPSAARRPAGRRRGCRGSAAPSRRWCRKVRPDRRPPARGAGGRRGLNREQSRRRVMPLQWPPQPASETSRRPACSAPDHRSLSRSSFSHC